ncbi:MAG: nitrite reductase small subunit NirD [Gammaproteobacteria bacterium]
MNTIREYAPEMTTNAPHPHTNEQFYDHLQSYPLNVWIPVCHKRDLVAWSGITVRSTQGEQIALFYIPGKTDFSEKMEQIYAISNIDPFSGTGVLARGIVSSLKGQTVVASPLYKQRFNLENGQCLEDDNISIRTWPARLVGGYVEIKDQAPR